MTLLAKDATPQLDEQIIWLTGASSGIGAALTKALSDQCLHLYISARNRDKLEALADGCERITVLPADITDEESLEKAAAEILKQSGRLDTLIANAGTCEYVDALNIDTDMFRRVHETNFMGMVNTVKAALPLLRHSRRGYIAGVSSSVTYLAMPRAQAYGSSKAAVTHFLEAMKADLAAVDIDVSVISPGFVKTPLTDVNDFPMPMLISPEEAAAAIIKGLQKRPWQIDFPRRFTLLLSLLGHLPAFLRHRLTRAMSRTGEDAKDHPLSTDRKAQEKHS